MQDFVAGSTSVITTIFLQDSASTVGAGKTGLVFNTASLTCYYKRSNGTVSVAVSLADITTLGTFVSGGFKSVDGTNMPGVYEFHPPNAAFASGAKEVTFFFVGASGLAARPIKYRITSVDLDDSVRGGMTALPNAAANANGGLPILSSSGTTLGYTVTTTGSVTGAVGSVTGNVGGNVTGSVGSISGVTFPTNFASLVVDASGRMQVQYGTSTGQINLSAGNLAGAVPSVTGAVGSVTGNVGGNVVGSTASVAGAVGSVTGNVGGNVSGNVTGSTGSVLGSVGSVTGAVGSVTGSVGSVASGVGGDVAGKVLGGGSGTISGDGVRASSVTGAVGSVTGAVGSVVGAVTIDFTTALPSTPTSNTVGLALYWAGKKPGRRNTCQAGSTEFTAVLDPAASADDNIYQGHEITLTGGTGSGQVGTIMSYVGSTKTAVIARSGGAGGWTTVPDNTTTFMLEPQALSNIGLWVGAAPNALVSGRVDARASSVSDKTGYSLNLSQVGLTPRALDSIADNALTIGDAFVAAISGAAGKEVTSGLSYVVKTPSTGTIIRSFTLDSATAPTSRT